MLSMVVVIIKQNPFIIVNFVNALRVYPMDRLNPSFEAEQISYKEGFARWSIRNDIGNEHSLINGIVCLLDVAIQQGMNLELLEEELEKQMKTVLPEITATPLPDVVYDLKSEDF